MLEPFDWITARAECNAERRFLLLAEAVHDNARARVQRATPERQVRVPAKEEPHPHRHRAHGRESDAEESFSRRSPQAFTPKGTDPRSLDWQHRMRPPPNRFPVTFTVPSEHPGHPRILAGWHCRDTAIGTWERKDRAPKA